jgi:hypothetical protein
MSTIKTNTITGTTSAGSIVVTGEGGSTTTNLQQGLNKVWANLNGSSFGLRDSFNVASATDNGTGDYTETFTNSMANANYSPACVVQDDQSDTANMGGTAATIYRASTGLATGNCRIGTGVAGTSSRNDDTTLSIIIAGDLA